MLSWCTKTLWAKKSRGNQDNNWLPLVVHMSDSAEIAKLLWRDWLPSCTKRRIAEGIFKGQSHIHDFEDAALSCFVFLSACHDLGKATPAFQGKLTGSETDMLLYNQIIDVGLPLPNTIHSQEARHYWASQLILEKHKFPRKLAVIVGGHHGKPPNLDQLSNLRTSYKKDLGWHNGQESWCQVQQELLEHALNLSGVSVKDAQSWQPDIAAQVLLSGLIIMVDWIVSNESYFPYFDLPIDPTISTNRSVLAWDELKLPECWLPDNDWTQSDFYKKRFGYEFKPRPLQSEILQLLSEISHPGIVILEAPMGEGKTEAALAAAEVMANITERSGIFFALPTQASANGLFLRICSWVEKLGDGVKHSVNLAHGKANLNELYNKIKVDTKEFGSFLVGGEVSEETDDDPIIVHEWLSGRKKGILADFVIGTIDQVLMGGLKQKHLALRHLGLANKVVIIDECHAYDAYMSQYLYKVLSWLGVYKVPVIVLSATLPGEKRKQLIEAYLNEDFSPIPYYDPVFHKEIPEAPPLPSWSTTCDYPILTFSNGSDVCQKKINGKQRTLKVKLSVLPSDDQILSTLKDLLSDGGCAGIIVNSVKRAQSIAYELSQYFNEEEVNLLHSRFISMDRAQKEKTLFDKLGAKGERPHRCIIVGTQIFEQSCDLDFDILISDICPMDLLIQRIGRLHRHCRNRPSKLSQPQCFITGMYDNDFERGTELIYGKYLLMNTRQLLPPEIIIPKDIPRLVQETYSPDGLTMPVELQEEYSKAKNNHLHLVDKKIAKSHVFQISDPYTRLNDLIGWLDTSITDDSSGKRGEATVRDVENSMEVLVVQKRRNHYYMLPWIAKYGGHRIPTDIQPEINLARAMAECSLQLPRELCLKIDETIKELEIISLRELYTWQQSPWLKGELFLVLDEQFSTELCGYKLQYNRNYGMLSKKIEKRDVNEREDI